MNREFYEALTLLEKERGIPVDTLITQIKRAIVSACKNTYGNNDDVLIDMDAETGKFDVYLNKVVVEQVTDVNKEISLFNARRIDAKVGYGEKVAILLDPKQFGRIAVGTAKSIIRQGIRDGEKGQILQEFNNKKKEVVNAVVERIEPDTGIAVLKLGRCEARLPKSEQVCDKQLKVGDHIKIYVVDVKESDKNEPRAIISRWN